MTFYTFYILITKQRTRSMNWLHQLINHSNQTKLDQFLKAVKLQYRSQSELMHVRLTILR